MRSPFPLALSFVAIIAVAACSRTPPAGVAPVTRITIGLDASGAVIVDVDPLTVARNKSPVVAWGSDASMQGRQWIVGFGGLSPFLNRQSVFTSDSGRDRAPILRTAGLGEYKYWVWVSDDNGDWIELDPKIVIIDDPGADSIGGGNGGG